MFNTDNKYEMQFRRCCINIFVHQTICIYGKKIKKCHTNDLQWPQGLKNKKKKRKKRKNKTQKVNG